MFKDTPVFGGFSVDDLAAAKEFYGQKLGITVSEDEMGLELQLHGDVRIFVYAKPDHQPATYTILNFVADDIDKAVADLKANGVELEVYPDLHQDESGITRGRAVGMGPDIAWFKDPAGNVLAVLQDD
jgi:predicted enzyme related to lactoylglutathione lyase